MIDRRGFVAAGLLWTPLAALLAACGKAEGWPEAMAPVAWDRDTCARCSMAISDRRFAVEMRGGPNDTAFKFDDIGCAVVWIRDKASDHPWIADAATQIWVADLSNRGADLRWLDARKAQYVASTSPMAYNFGAVAHPQAGAVDFETLRQHVLARGK